jgi:hypothetical protein
MVGERGGDPARRHLKVVAAGERYRQALGERQAHEPSERAFVTTNSGAKNIFVTKNAFVRNEPGASAA